MRRILALAAFLAFTGAASAQMSVTRFGSSDAESCYREALAGIGSDTSNCDQALRDSTLIGRDRRATVVNRAIIYNRSGRAAKALDDLNGVLEEEATLAEALLNRGNSNYLLSRFDAALADYEAALDNGLKKSEVGWYNIGLAYEAKKEPKKAEEAYRKSIAANAAFTPALEKLAGKSQEN